VRTIVKGKNFDVPDHIRRYAERKLGRLERILDDRSEALVELSVEQHRNTADSHIVEVTLVIDGKTLRTRAAGGTHRVGVDEVVDKLERRAVDHREKPRIHARPDEEKALLRTIADGTADTARERQVVKTKRFAIEPMFEEDALARMDELGHQFFVYVDAESERVHILYRRNDGNYGLIEPIVGGEYTKGRSRAGVHRSNGTH
jgi:putative sigma-54 modulation protein